MFYANARQLSGEATNLAINAQSPLRRVCVDASAVDDFNYSAAETLHSVHGLLKEKGIKLVVAQVMKDVKTESRYELRKLFGDDAFFDTPGDYMTAYPAQAKVH